MTRIPSQIPVIIIVIGIPVRRELYYHNDDIKAFNFQLWGPSWLQDDRWGQA